MPLHGVGWTNPFERPCMSAKFLQYCKHFVIWVSRQLSIKNAISMDSSEYMRKKRSLTEFEASINRVLECYKEEEGCRRQLQEVLIDPNAVDGIVENFYGNPRIILEQILIHIFGEDNLWKLSIKEEPHSFKTIYLETL
ncbi:uncharacterized protein LOC122511456 isoform X1 [Leptopilina heterotoma]|uniref:uncharacterized protein LOC122511456 isoform X1 n=1 Tax=Leptopilina heterotoma TaxID=63436 RepID=UPI001CA85FC0|nr:uncharacterized protein LOC122511456 isoform X1 [Leptopilina heterotoma]